LHGNWGYLGTGMDSTAPTACWPMANAAGTLAGYGPAQPTLRGSQCWIRTNRSDKVKAIPLLQIMPGGIKMILAFSAENGNKHKIDINC